MTQVPWFSFPHTSSNSERYTDDTTLMAESEEELKSFLKKVKEESNNNPVYETAKETLMYRTVLWTLWEPSAGSILVYLATM